MSDTSLNDSLNVFIVEDEFLIAMDMEETLEAAGHVVVGMADSFEEVLNSRTILTADVVLLDLNLATAFTGFDVCNYLRTQTESMVILFVSANAPVIDADKSGGDGVLDKPVSGRALTDTLAYVCEGIRRPPPKSAAPHWASFGTKFKQRILVA
jgi:two-component system, response regulator PdtaR